MDKEIQRHSQMEQRIKELEEALAVTEAAYRREKERADKLARRIDVGRQHF